MNARTNVSDKEREQRCTRRHFLAGAGSAAGAFALGVPTTTTAGAANWENVMLIESKVIAARYLKAWEMIASE